MSKTDYFSEYNNESWSLPPDVRIAQNELAIEQERYSIKFYESLLATTHIENDRFVIYEKIYGCVVRCAMLKAGIEELKKQLP